MHDPAVTKKSIASTEGSQVPATINSLQIPETKLWLDQHKWARRGVNGLNRREPWRPQAGSSLVGPELGSFYSAPVSCRRERAAPSDGTTRAAPVGSETSSVRPLRAGDFE